MPSGNKNEHNIGNQNLNLNNFILINHPNTIVGET